MTENDRAARNSHCESGSPGANDAVTALFAALALLVHDARQSLRSDDVNLFREKLASAPGVATLIEAAERHRLVGAFSVALGNFTGAGEHRELKDAVRARGRKFTAQSIRANTQLRSLSRTLNERGIRHAAFKGPVFSAQAIGPHIPRQFVDLDVVVPKDRLSEVVQILYELGYRSSEWEDAPFRSWALQHLHHIHFSPSAGFTLELHWRTAPPWVDPEGRALTSGGFPSTVDVDGVETFELGYHFARTVEHHARHGWSRLAMVLDALSFQKGLECEASPMYRASMTDVAAFNRAVNAFDGLARLDPFSRVWRSPAPYAEDFGEQRLFRAYSWSGAMKCRIMALEAAASFPERGERLYRLARLPAMWLVSAAGITDGPHASQDGTILNGLRRLLGTSR
jgi:hypothetical protein